MARRRSSTTSISATRPVFPNYLLSSFNFVFHRRKSTSPASPTSSSHSSPSSSSTTTPPGGSNSPTHHASVPSKDQHQHQHQNQNQNLLVRRVSRAAPDTLRCRSCSTDVALAAQIISKGFTGRYGRAFLVAPTPPSSSSKSTSSSASASASACPPEQSLLNIRAGRSEDRQLVTGWHVVADICCATCNWKLGWKYVDAREASQKYKVGKYILETDRVVTHRNWEDFAVQEDAGLMDGGGGGGGDGGTSERASLEDSDEIVFDSDDEEECEDIFSGTWDAGRVAKRRSQTVARTISLVV
ncbi:hypothetical protein E4U55_007726 [Claviceps digitariae]|nr:hypothetical protein E4U55_007726 [Claviceps digitariae]